MNTDILLQVKRVLTAHDRQSDLGFNMAVCSAPADEYNPDRTGHDCGTVMCIGGWIDYLSGETRPYQQNLHSAKCILFSEDFTEGQNDAALRLFCPGSDFLNSSEARTEFWSRITTDQACRAIDNFIEDPFTDPWEFLFDDEDYDPDPDRFDDYDPSDEPSHMQEARTQHAEQF